VEIRAKSASLPHKGLLTVRKRTPSEEPRRAARTVFWWASASACALLGVSHAYPCSLLVYALEFAVALSLVTEASLICGALAGR